MIIFQLVISVILVAIWSTLLAPILQYAFKLTEGEKNTFADAYRICFIANFIHHTFSGILPTLLGKSWIFTSLGPIVGVIAFTYLIAKELGDLKRSLLIALLLEGLTVLFVFALMALIVTFAVVAT
tara:strand:+ start:913 stop:1290 length:378 start_codon:yes stop_codon:yes gene_type:complete